MKIAIIRQRYNPYGGAERFVSRALAALSRHQTVDLHLIARKWEVIDGIRFHRCNPFYIGRLMRDLGFALSACSMANKLGADLVQSHERLCCCDIYRAGDGVHRQWLTQRSRSLGSFAKLLLQINPYHLYVKAAERRMFESQRLRAVICNSQMVKDEILEAFRIEAAKIHVIRNGIDTQAFHPDIKQQREHYRQQWQIPTTQTVYVFVGSGYQRKGLQQTIQAFSKLQQGHLLVVGYDKQEKHYRNLAAKLKLGERVRFLGSQQDVKPFYALADAFILPTLYDPFPNAVLEAMACGLPVITSSKSGAAEVLTHGESGFICDALDIAGLSETMRQLQNPDKANSMGMAARSIAEQHDWQIIGDSLTSLYQALTTVSD